MKFADCLCTTALVSLSVISDCASADHHEEDAIRMIEPSVFKLDQTDIDNIKQRMQEAVDGGFIPGALILVGNSDGVGLLETAGFQTSAGRNLVNSQTIFRIFSMTKPIVSVAAMSLIEDGLLALDDPIEKYIPEFSNLQVIDRDSGEIRAAQNSITIENLLSHESGLIQAIFSPNSELGKIYQRDFPDYSDITARDLAGRIGELPVYFEPGSAWHYGHSTDVLGAVLEVAAGKALDQVLNERIFEPLGMDETSFYLSSDKSERIAEPNFGAMADNTKVRAMLSGGGGLNSTTEDYVRFAEMLLRGGEYRGTRIIEESTLGLMREKRIGSEVSREFFFYGETGDWGLGFHLQPTTEDPDGPHNFGWRGIGGTLFLVDEENDFYMIYMEQKRGGPRAPFNNNVAQRMVYEAMRD